MFYEGHLKNFVPHGEGTKVHGLYSKNWTETGQWKDGVFVNGVSKKQTHEVRMNFLSCKY